VPISRKKDWDLTGQSFGRLLEFLDADRSRAAERYEKTREKLIRFFEWKGCIPGADFADETMDRVARRIEEGIETQPENPYLYFHGVAVNLVRERWRRAATDPQPLEVLTREIPSVNPFDEGQRRSSEVECARRLGCLHDCLDRLTPASRELLTAYHLGESGPRIGKRQGIAQRLNVPAGALRLRVYRIRRQLERCVKPCMGEK
jgi:DNA-directed RNA polymerase specialized sigma24 family protein